MRQTKTLDQLSLMTDKQLYNYFCKHAGYMEDAQPNAKYIIRLGSLHLHSDDTKKLFDKFIEKVRTHKPTKES